MRFSVRYLPTSLFSLKASNATNSGAKTLFLPSPYAIKMAILNQAITTGGQLKELQAKNSVQFQYIRDSKISFFIEAETHFSINNLFVKVLKPSRTVRGWQPTVAFREYVYISRPFEIIFDVVDDAAEKYLKTYLHRINYFGKRGCFVQFLEYVDNPNEANVTFFNAHQTMFGVLQEYEDFDRKATFESVSSFSGKKALRKRKLLVLPVKSTATSKSFTMYESI